MKSRILIMYVLLLSVLDFGIGCKKNSTDQNPSFISFSPQIATIGDPIKITGSNFTGAIAVSFGGTQAQSFKIISDSVIFAHVGGGGSGDIVITTGKGSVSKTGFTYYTPQRVDMTGNCRYAWFGGRVSPDSASYSERTVADMESFTIKNINKFDSVINRINGSPAISPYVDSVNFVLLSGLNQDCNPLLSDGGCNGGYKFNVNGQSNIYAKITDTIITIPSQTIYNVIIRGNGTIKNNRLTLQYSTYYRGMERNVVLTSQ